MGAWLPLRVQVFDASASHALLQVVMNDIEPYVGEGEELPAPPVSCAYPGMQEWPLAGVSLSVVNLETGDADGWMIYAPAKWGAAACTSQEGALQQRERAEAAARAVGLDPNRRLAPIRRVPELPLEGCFKGVAEGSYTLPNGRLRSVERSGSNYGAHGFLVDDQIRYADSRWYNPAMAGSASIEIGDAWPAGLGYTFVEIFWSFQGICYASVGLTPVIVPTP
jgi:hypothetical protein